MVRTLACSGNERKKKVSIGGGIHVRQVVGFVEFEKP